MGEVSSPVVRLAAWASPAGWPRVSRFQRVSWALQAPTTASAQPYGYSHDRAYAYDSGRTGYAVNRYRDSDRDGIPDVREWNRDRDHDGIRDQYDRYDNRRDRHRHHQRWEHRYDRYDRYDGYRR